MTIKHFNSYTGDKIKKEDAIYEMVFGSTSANESFNWLPYLPKRERQWWIPWCVAMSRLNCAEAKALKKGLDIDFSDWRLAVESGTTKVGNGMNPVAEWFRLKGVDLEADTPFPVGLINDGWPAWNKIQKLPKEGKRYFGGSHSWVLSKNGMIDALNEENGSPLQIAVSDSDTNWERDGEVQKPVLKPWSHAVMLYYIDKEGRYYIQDSIGKEFKILNPNYPIIACKSFRDLPDNWKDTMNNNFIKIIKDANSSAVGFWVPAINEEVLKNLALVYGKPIALKEDCTIDWDKIIEGSLTLK